MLCALRCAAVAQSGSWCAGHIDRFAIACMVVADACVSLASRPAGIDTQISPYARIVATSIVELQRELDDSRVVAGRDDPPEISRIDDPTGPLINAAGRDGVEVANRIGEVYVVEQVEEFSAELDLL